MSQVTQLLVNPIYKLYNRYPKKKSLLGTLLIEHRCPGLFSKDLTVLDPYSNTRSNTKDQYSTSTGLALYTPRATADEVIELV